MATYHCSMKSGSRGKGASAAAHSDYIERDGRYDDRDDLVHRESGNMPDWCDNDATKFWSAADEFERANGRVYTEIEIALPNELTEQQQIELVRDFVEQELGDKHAYTFAIHAPDAALEPDVKNIHAHIMFSERNVSNEPPERYFSRNGGGKDRDWNRREKVVEVREAWADIQNDRLKELGHDVEVSHLSLSERGIERDPEPHLGPVTTHALVSTDSVHLFKEEFRVQDVEITRVIEEPAQQDTAAEPAQVETLRDRIGREAREYAEKHEKPAVEEVKDPRLERLEKIEKELAIPAYERTDKQKMERNELKFEAYKLRNQLGIEQPEEVKKEISRGPDMDM